MGGVEMGINRIEVELVDVLTVLDRGFAEAQRVFNCRKTTYLELP